MNALFMDNAFSTIHFDKEKFINTPYWTMKVNPQKQTGKWQQVENFIWNIILPGVLNTIV